MAEGLANVRNLAEEDAAEEDRKRKQQLLALQADEERLADQVAERKLENATGPAGLLESLTGGRKAAVAGDVQRAAEEDQFLNEQATRRFTRQASGLAEKKRDLLAPTPSAAERYAEMSAPLGRFANEDPTLAAAELKTNRGGREAELRALKDQIVGGNVSRGTDRPIMVGRGDADEPYFTNLSPSELHDERRATNAIRERAGLEALSGGPHDFQRIRVGGTSLGGGGRADKAQAARVESIDSLIDQASRARLTPQEMAQDLVTQLPGWDVRASRATDPAEIEQTLNEEVGAGRLRPETGQYLQRRYKGIAQDAYSPEGEFRPEIWQSYLAHGRTPAPGEPEHRAQTAGAPVAEAEQGKQEAIQDALQAPPGGPGATQSPALAAESTKPGEGFLAGLAGAAQRGTERFGNAPMPETPPALAASAARYGVPALAAMATGGASLPITAAAGFGGGAGGELLGELLGGEKVNPGAVATSGLAGGILAPLGNLAGRGLARGARSLGALGKRVTSPIRSIYAEGGGGAPTQVLGGQTEQAGFQGVRQGGASTREMAQMYNPDALEPLIGPKAYLKENLPALRGGGYTESGARIPDEVLSIEDLINQFLQQNRRALPPPMR